MAIPGSDAAAGAGLRGCGGRGSGSVLVNRGRRRWGWVIVINNSCETGPQSREWWVGRGGPCGAKATTIGMTFRGICAGA